MDYTNWNVEREKLKQEIFKDLRKQRDRKELGEAAGTFTINPQLIKNTDPKEYGPYYFETRFTQTPHLTFGQVLDNPTSFYAVLPVITRWQTARGAVEGFYVQLYALTDSPAGITKHVLTWKATGKASSYKGQNVREAWTTGYENTGLAHLIDNGT